MTLLAVKNRINDYIERGNVALQAKNHPHALVLYEQALHALHEDDVSNPASKIKVYFRLITIELDLSCSEDMSIDEKLKHHRKAEEYGDMTLTATHAIGSSGVLEQVRLEQSFVKGRKVELEERKLEAGKAGPIDAVYMKREKREAREELERAMSNLRAVSPGKSVGYEKRFGTWLERLSEV